jgi:diguanylate cyclase (GGDEF)-like protein/PAS domain S-box-containing protein
MIRGRQSRVWKIGLLLATICLLVARMPHGLLLVTFVLGGASIALAGWTVWDEHNRAVQWNAAQLEHFRFLAAAETSLDAFALLESVRDETGVTVDFRFDYVNANIEKMLGRPRREVSGETLLGTLPFFATNGLFERLCTVVESGEPVVGEFAPARAPEGGLWMRYQAVKLGDGVAITLSDISTLKATQERYAKLAEFNDSIFQSAPFSIIATDPRGMITAMNLAAERMTGYSREELVGKFPLTHLHDPRELAKAASVLETAGIVVDEDFEVLTAGAARGEMKEKEWICVRHDGTKIPINLAVRAIFSDGGEVSGYVGIAFDVTERRRMLDHVTHLATHDQLTGLAGRALLQEKAMQAVELAGRYGTKVALFIIDLDQFKRINDSLGHLAGDQILLETAGRLRRAVRGSDTVARVGGDEFVVVMPDITSMAVVEQCALNLVKKLGPEIAIDGQLVHVSASVGVCVYPDFATDARHLLKRADAALYAAKENGRNQHQIFSEDMLKETKHRLTMEHALRYALVNEELSLHYQPLISLSSGAVVGMEALLRWKHPVLGEVAPAQFIPLAEETGLIVPIGEWVMQTACRESQQLREELQSDLTVSINLSPRQFQQKNLLRTIEHALAQSNLPARSLEIEITENMLMVNSSTNLETLQQIRELGARISIDDFGTGFCSFTYLLQYQVDRLKIDQSFVRQAVNDGNAAAVVRTIIAMSHGLNIKLIAEGVETEEQLRFLLRRRCDEAQGNFFAGPIPAQDFAAVVRSLQGADVLQSVQNVTKIA